jgi:hypothetical protein
MLSPGGTILPRTGGLGATAGGAGGSGRKPPAAGQQNRCKPPLGPLTHAIPASLQASRREDSLQNCSQAGVLAGGGERAGAGRPQPKLGAGGAQRPRGLPTGWGLLRPSARSCLGAGLACPGSPARRGGRRRGRTAAKGAAATVASARGKGPYSPGPAASASASAASTAASAVHPCGGGPVAAALE